MMRARNANLALVFAGLLSMVGCCYHEQHFGSERDIGIGEEGCATCKNGCCPSKSSSTFAPGAGDDCCSSKSQCCPAKTTCSDCTTEPDTGRSCRQQELRAIDVMRADLCDITLGVMQCLMIIEKDPRRCRKPLEGVA